MTSTLTQPVIAAGTYRIEPRRTAVVFTMREWYGLKSVEGRFAVRDGTILVGPEPSGSSVRVEMDPASFQTDKKQRDKDIRSKRWLDVETFPEMTYAGSRITADAEGWRIDGELTVHGVTAPVTLRMTGGEQLPQGCKFTATCVIDRRDFGVTLAPRFIGTRLDVRIEVYAARVS